MELDLSVLDSIGRPEKQQTTDEHEKQEKAKKFTDAELRFMIRSFDKLNNQAIAESMNLNPKSGPGRVCKYRKAYELLRARDFEGLQKRGDRSTGFPILQVPRMAEIMCIDLPDAFGKRQRKPNGSETAHRKRKDDQEFFQMSIEEAGPAPTIKEEDISSPEDGIFGRLTLAEVTAWCRQNGAKLIIGG